MVSILNEGHYLSDNTLAANKEQFTMLIFNPLSGSQEVLWMFFLHVWGPMLN